MQTLKCWSYLFKHTQTLMEKLHKILNLAAKMTNPKPEGFSQKPPKWFVCCWSSRQYRSLQYSIGSTLANKSCSFLWQWKVSYFYYSWKITVFTHEAHVITHSRLHWSELKGLRCFNFQILVTKTIPTIPDQCTILKVTVLFSCDVGQCQTSPGLISAFNSFQNIENYGFYLMHKSIVM